MSFYIGISGGHTRSTAVVVANGTVLGCVAGKSLNHHAIHYLKVAQRLGELLLMLSARTGIELPSLLKDAAKTVLAMPGASTQMDQSVVAIACGLAGLGEPTRRTIVDDTWAGLMAGSEDCRGICVYAGTGASVFVGYSLPFPQGKPHKIDGWGPLLGDFGSGFQLATRLFRVLGRAHDRGQPSALLPDLLNSEVDIEAIAQVQQWFDTLHTIQPEEWRVSFAKLAGVVTRAADREPPEAEAQGLVVEVANELTESIDIAINRFSPDATKLPIILHGGMFEYSRLFRDTVIASVQTRHANTVQLARHRPVIGAVLLACTEGMKCPAPELRTSVLTSTDALADEESSLVTYRYNQGEPTWDLRR